MCWLYGNKQPCHVCFRLQRATENPMRSTDKPEDMYGAGFNTRTALPETERLAKNHHMTNALFNNIHEQKKKREENKNNRKRDISLSSATLWEKMKRRKITSDEAEKRARLELAGVKINTNVPVAHARLYRFLGVLDILRSAKWSCIRFEPNEDMLKRMVATHLEHIVGKKEYKEHKTDLLNIISSKLGLNRIGHIVWITNRQNGKTTTLSRFLAAMAIMSVSGGPLIYVYSTNRDRAIELIDGSKRYIHELRTNNRMKVELAQIGVSIPSFEANNSIGFSIRSAVDPSVINIIKARPKTADSCRGDAPHACLFDEVGFVTGSFWNEFAFPLIQVGDRVFTMATTPAHTGSFFANFTNDVVAANKNGNYMFSLINHNIECERCREADVECYHKMHMVPTWKPVTGYNKAKDFVSEKYADDYKKEFRGVITESNNRFFPEKWIRHFFNMDHARPFDNMSNKNLDVYIAVDPPSHAVSFMGLNAIVYNGEHAVKHHLDLTTPGGLIYLVGHAEVGVKDSQMLELSRLVISFTMKVLEALVNRNRPAKNIRVVPTVECNNNEFIANTLMQRITETATLRGCKTSMPYTRNNFTKEIKDHVGIWTTDVTKYASIQLLINTMQDKRIWVWNQCVTIGAIFQKRSVEPTTKAAIGVLAEELVQFQSTDKGPSGKSANTNDDGAMALLINLYFSWRVRSIELLKDK